MAGSVFFLWVGSRLAGCLRVALREIFELDRRRHIVLGKLFDLAAAVIGVLLLTLNLGVTVAAMAALDTGVTFLGLGGETVTTAEQVTAIVIAFASIWVLVLFAYRFIPSQPIPWRTAVVAATFTAVAHETLKFGFSWYVTEIASWRSTLGTLTTAAVFFFLDLLRVASVLFWAVKSPRCTRRGGAPDVATAPSSTGHE